MTTIIKIIMQKRFPRARFGAYFAFLAKHRNSGAHRHHIAPRCEFPELAGEKDNLVNLSYEDHVRAHVLLSNAVPGHGGFRAAVLFNQGQTARAFMEASRQGGIMSAKSGGTARARTFLSEKDYRAMRAKSALTNAASGWANCRKASAAQTPENLRQAGLKGRMILGREGLRVAGAKGRAAMAAMGLTPAMAGRVGGHVYRHVKQGIVKPSCELCMGAA
jgi:hypothetical protein